MDWLRRGRTGLRFLLSPVPKGEGPGGTRFIATIPLIGR